MSCQITPDPIKHSQISRGVLDTPELYVEFCTSMLVYLSPLFFSYPYAYFPDRVGSTAYR